ncbi:unnamed protein product, partial [Medioppia subpectinata]
RPVLPLSVWTVETKEGWVTNSNITFTLTSNDPDSKTVSCYAVSETLGETIVQTLNIDILSIIYAEILHQKKYSVSMGGNPLPTLRWQVLNIGSDVGLNREISALTSMSGSGVSSELVIRAEPGDNGVSYRCEASNAATFKPLSASIKLSVFYTSDSVTIKLKPKYPKSGDVLHLVCDSGSCNPMCDLFWYKNGIKMESKLSDVLETNGPFGGKNTRSTLKQDITAKDDESHIFCESVNQVLSKRNGANITLIKPQFLAPPQQKYDVIESEDISVNLSARSNPSLISYIWWKDSLPLLDISDTTTSMSLSNAITTHRQHRRQHQLISRGPVLTIKNALREDAGEYDCEATNTEGSTKTTIIINTVITESGESVQLYCLCVANPMSDEIIRWRREGNSNFIKEERIDAQNERGKSVLSIFNVSADRDSGVYECRANNGIGVEAVERVQVLIKSKPEIVLNMTAVNVAADESETVKMVCTATGVPKVQFKWLDADGQVFSTESDLLVNNNVKYFRYNLERKQISETVFQSAFIIKSITDSELNKSFECIAHNDKGKTQTVIKLRKRGKPDPPLHIKLVNITHNTVCLNWSPGFDGGLKQSFRVKFYTIGQNNYQSKETDRNWIIIKGLESASKYNFAVHSYNGFGESNGNESNNSIIASTFATEFDSSEALTDGFNKPNRNKDQMTGKPNISNANKVKVKDAVNGETILLKAFNEEEVDITTALTPIDDQSTYIDDTDAGKHCEVLLMNDLHSSSSTSIGQPLNHVLLRNCQNLHLTNGLSLEAQNCPDIIKNPNIDNCEMDASNAILIQKQLNSYCNHINAANNTNESVISYSRGACNGQEVLLGSFSNGCDDDFKSTLE